MRVIQLLGVFLGLLSFSLAVFNDEAFVVDWEIMQIGQLNKRNVLSPKRDVLYILTDRNVLTAVKDGKVDWRVSFDDARVDANNRIVPYGDDGIITGLNFFGRSVIKLWDAKQGFLKKTLRFFEEELVDLVTLSNGSVAAVLINGNVVVMDGNGSITYTGKIRSSKDVKLSTLSNGNFAVLYNELETQNAHIGIFNGENLEEHEIPATFNSIVEFYGSKIVFKTSKYYLITINSKTFQLSEVKALPSFEKYIPLETDEYIAFEKNHHVKVLTNDVQSHFTIENVHKYALNFASSSFVLYTEFHANILDADTGEELKSHFLEEQLDHDSTVTIYSSTDDIEEISTLIHFKNNTYSFFSNEEKIWTRDISLSNITAHAVVDLLVDTTITGEEIRYEEGLDIFNAYLYRIRRHLVELKDFYDYFWLLLEQWSTNEIPDSSIWKNKYFGFEKLLITGAENGRVIALNTVNGKEVWTFDTDGFPIVSIENVHNDKLYVFTSSGTRFIVNATNGELLNKHAISPPTKVTRLSEDDDFLIEINDGFNVILSDHSERFDNTYFVKHSKSYIQGFVIQNTKTHATWKFDVSADEEIIGYTTKDSTEEVANVGIILGDRKVLYKYLYPNMAAFGVLNKVTKALYIHIIDTVTGELLHSSIHDELVHENDNFNIVFGEHWVVYSYWSNLPVPDQKIVVIDLFESLVPNVRLSNSNDTQSAFDFKILPAVLSKSFILPYRVNSLGISKTRFGITTKAIIVSLTNGQILSIPKPILNSRRVEGRQLTEAEKLEGLLPYDPVIMVDVNHVISHKRDILAANTLISIPTNLESTTIICSYGLDVFCTRISPSLQFDKLTNSFDYIKLTGSIVLLVITYTVMTYFNNSKKLKNAWVYED